MARTAGDEIRAGVVVNGHDYKLQVWVRDYIIQDCGHPVSMHPDCCPAHRLAGLDIRNLSGRQDRS